MRYQVDHDYHIHSQLSLCSSDPEQTTDRILRYAQENAFREIVLTDHFWDEMVPAELTDFYEVQDYAHVAQALPLPQADGVRFRFGCEAEIDKHLTLGISPERFDRFEFVIIPTTHLHMGGFTVEPNRTPAQLAEIWVERLDFLLGLDLPFEKVGIAHLTCPLLAGTSGMGPGQWEEHIRILDRIPDEALHDLFARAAAKGCGIELNYPCFSYTPEQLERILRIYRAAKESGCRFYFGSDAHHPRDFERAKEAFEFTVDRLNLTEDDKFRLPD